ncbi:hypothetical protein AV926_11430 [Myroides marinus]|uniref:Uncharacterized protein n=1 Tax=Myroides marinus TaxID=703342 RepID=A0A165RY05_9FLAO|nr:hypothetical protein [Myroides marinus]KUF44056.1 hypothetical protein AS361_06220 [Myroides marinus]KZE79783.1 hypothetical protein AV926_11430 [Myroides marinus]
MWFNTLKKRSLKKVVEKAKLNALPVDFKYEFKEIGIVIDKADARFIPDLIKAFEKRGVNSHKIKILIYTSENKKKLDQGHFGLKDFTISGGTENIEVLDFIDKKFDLLISYYSVTTSPLIWVTAKSNAIFKVGVSDENTELNHFSLTLKTLEVEGFIENLFKYINVFKH